MDHIGSVWQAQKETGAPVALHKGDLEFFRTGEGAKVKSVCPAGHILRALMNLGVSSGIKKQDPDIILDSDFDLRPYGVQGKVLHTPGHTPGSVSVILQSGEAIVGDLIMGGFIHKTNPGLPLFADNLEEVRSSIRKVLSYSPSIIHAAHGGPFSPADVRRNIGIGES
jgi:glyoxylase-like metal-dependent hydrolase (beta-lactamase superfamily II)